MKKILLWLVGVALFAGLIAGAGVIYNNYLEDNKPGNVVILGGNRTEGDTREESESGTKGESLSGAEETESRPAGDGTWESGSDVEKPESDSSGETETDSPYLAPDVTVYTAEGKPVKLSEFRGKPIVLNFWASDCPYCVQEMPEFQAAYEKYGDEVAFLMVCITSFRGRSVEYEQAFIDRLGYSFPVYYDTTDEVAYTFGISSLPVTYFIDRKFDLYTMIPGKADAESLEYCIDLILK